MKVRLTQLDGKLPNVALMRLSHFLKAGGHEVHFSKSPIRQPGEPEYDHVYGSSIFTFSHKIRVKFRQNFPHARIRGTGSSSFETLENLFPGIGLTQDYSIYPDYMNSIGFLLRGCRLKCKFCVVPQKEGKPFSNMRVFDLWRGYPFPRNLHLLDNDFFGLPEWKEHLESIRNGGFKVCFSQGINIRMITEETAAALALIQYRDTKFKQRRLYTAWDNLGDEKRFFEGVDMLEYAGIPPKHLMVYMLVGYADGETFEDIRYRFDRMVERGLMPYPMVYDNLRRDLKAFQRWVVRGVYRYIPWEEYTRKQAEQDALKKEKKHV